MESKLPQSRVIDLTGQTFGQLTALKFVGLNHNKSATWQCICTCGKEHITTSNSLRSGKVTSCGCLIFKYDKRSVGQLRYHFWNRIVGNAKSRNIPINISIHDASNLFDRQQFKCVLSGDILILNRSDSLRNEITASLDRIDSTKGYILNNVQWIHKDINMLKMHWDQDYFISLCHKVSKFNS